MGGSAYLAGAGCLSAVLGLIFALIGFASPYWISYETGTSGTDGYVNNYNGLWQLCKQVNTEDRKCESMVDDDNPGWLEACQALATMGFLGTLMGTVLLICWSCTYRLSSVLKITIILTLLVSFVFLAVTVIVYRAEVFDSSIVSTLDYDLDWSFYLMVVGGVFVAVAVACVIPASPSDYGQQKYPYGFPYGLGLQNIMNGGRGYYGDPGYGRVSRPVYGRTGAGVYGRSPGGTDGYYDREPYRTIGGAYDPYSRRDRRY